MICAVRYVCLRCDLVRYAILHEFRFQIKSNTRTYRQRQGEEHDARVREDDGDRARHGAGERDAALQAGRVDERLRWGNGQ